MAKSQFPCIVCGKLTPMLAVQPGVLQPVHAACYDIVLGKIPPSPASPASPPKRRRRQQEK